jgi:hypothetical protein
MSGVGCENPVTLPGRTCEASTGTIATLDTNLVPLDRQRHRGMCRRDFSAVQIRRDNVAERRVGGGRSSTCPRSVCVNAVRPRVEQLKP